MKATAGNAQATVTWTAAKATSICPLIDNFVTSSPEGITVYVSGSATSATVTNLLNGTSYTFTVTAEDIAAPGPPSSPSNAVTPTGTNTVPTAPQSVSATGANAQATVTWQPPTSRGGAALLNYSVTSSPGNIKVNTPNGSTTTATVTGLTNGTSYTFTVTATNSVGTGPASSASNAVIPATVPSAPTGVNAVRGNAQATVSWTAPTSNGGNAITGYVITPFIGSTAQTATTFNSTATTQVVTGLTNGTSYTFTVAAINAVGTGSASAASNAVTPATVPGAPTSVTATGGNAQATVSWAAPASNGGSAITGYVVTPYVGSTAQTATTFNSAATTQTVTGLTNGTAYTFKVAAINSVGTGAASAASASVTPATVPSAPTNVVATAANAQATVSWTAPTSNGGSAITSYTVTPYVGTTAGTPQSVGPTTTTTTVTGLTNGTTYTFQVVATNAVGSSAAGTSNAATPGTAPGAPTNVTATAGNGQATVTWAAPTSNGGNPITGYVVTPFVGSTAQTATTFNSTATTETVTALSNGTTYTFTVAAINAQGTGAASAQSNAVIPATVPGAPTNVSAIGGNAQATVSWTAPTSTGGSAITGYVVTPFIGSTAQTATTFNSTATTQTVTGLTNGMAYTFTVAAINSIGTGPASAQSAAVTPATVPSAPTNVSAMAGNGQATVAWTAPASNGGSAITSYTVTPYVGTTAQTPTTFNSTATTQTVTGLSNGTTYTFQVVATNSVGSGAAGISNAVTPATSPGAPSTVTATGGNAQATLSWIAPTSNGGSAITGYVVTPYISNVAQTATTFNSNATNETVTGLTNGTTYTFTVAAINAAGTGPASSPSNTVTPATVPSAPTALTVTGGNGQATLSWTAPSSNGGSAITGYLVTPYIGTSAQSSITFNSTATTETVTGLANGTTYTFTVAATNGVGTGPASAQSASVTPATVPAAPNNVTATGGNAQAVVSWVAPATNGGSAITGYTITPFVGTTAGTPQTAAATATSATVTGLVNGTTYTFQVAATNSVGTGSAGTSNAVTPMTVPQAPGSVTATGGNAQATVTWTTPANGGSAITGYTVTPFVGTTAGTSQTASASATSATVTGLVNGTTYTFQVVATNAVGNSAPGVSNYVTLATVPGAPTGVVASTGNAQSTVSWTAPSSNGGAAITGYTVTPFVGTTAGTPVTVSGTATSATVTGLTNGTTYKFQVFASNSQGSGLATTSNAVTMGLPSSPTNVTATAGANSAVVNWTAPSISGSSAISGYIVSALSGSQPLNSIAVGSSVTSVTVSGLVGGAAYTFQVVALNGQGSSPPSAPSPSVTPSGSSTTYASAVLSDAPSSYYRLGDPSGTVAADSSGAGRSGAYQNGSFQGATSMIGSDGADLATSFNGASGFVSAPSVSALAGDNTRSVELWFKAANSSQQVLFDSGAASTAGQGFLIGITQDGGISGVTPNTAGVYVTFNNDTVFVPGLHPGDGHTHHLVVTLQGTTVFVYFDDATASGFVNGGTWSALTAQPFTLPTTPNSTANSIDIGAGRSQVAGVGSAYFAGIIDEVAIYPTALSTARVNAHFLAAGDGPPSVPGSPIATGGANQATVTWTAAAPNGAPITSYLINTQSGSTCTAANATSVPGSATSVVITGLPAGTCAFTVTAINGFGYTSPTASTASVPISGAAATYASSVFGNAPVAYYRLGDSATPVADSSGKSNLAVVLGSVTQGAQGALPNDVDTATTFNGGYVQDQYFSSLPSGTSPRTYEAWIKTTSTSDQTLLSYTTTAFSWGSYANGIGITGSNQIEFLTAMDNNAGVWRTLAFTAPYSIANGAWHQIVLTWDGTTVTAYLDGQPVGSQAFNQNQGSVDGNGLILGSLTGGRRLSGSLDDVSIYASVLSAAQVLNHFNASGNSRPAAPTGITTLSGANKVTVNWSPVINPSAVTGYLVTAYQGTTPKNAISASGTSTTISGLQGGTAYTFQIQAANNFGIGLAGTSAAVTPTGGTTTYASTVLGDGPIYFYRLDDTSTLVADSSGNGRVAYASGNFTQGTSGALANDGDPAMTFTSTAYAQFAQGTGLPSGTSPRTYETWVKTSSTGDQVLLEFTTPGGCRVPANGLGISGGTQIEFLTAFDCNGQWFTLAFTAPYSIADGAWHQVAATWDGTTVTAYVDGQQIGATQAYSASQGTVDSNGLILGSIGGGRHLVGGLDDVSIYPTALTATQILNHFKASGNGLPGAPTGVTATSGQNSAVVKWTPPSPSVGAITKYTVIPTTDGIAGTAATTDGTATSVSVPNLTGGASYTFTVTAGNAIGNGPASAPSAAITINAAPNGTNPIGPGFGQYLYFRHFDIKPFPDGTVAFETENTLPTLSTWTIEGYLQTNPSTQTSGSGGAFGLINGQAGASVAGINWDQFDNASFVWPLAGGGQGSSALPAGTFCDSFFTRCPFKHVVLEYDGTNITGYVNGTLIYGPKPPASSAAISTNTLAGLVDHDLWGALGLDEVRISSVARYSGTSITEPAGPFTTDANTVLLWHLDEQGVRKMWQNTEPSSADFPGEFPDSSGNHHGMEFFSVGQNCIACGSTYRVYALGQGRTAAELDGDGSPWECPCTLSHSDWPINSATGEFWHTFDDISVPGRGFGLDFSRTYSSANASVLGPLGYGWSDTLQGGLTFATVNGVAFVTVHAGNGSAITFTQTGSTFTAAGQVLASLSLSGGVYTLTQQDGTQMTYDSTGKLTSEVDRNGYANTFNYDMTTKLLTSVTESNKGNPTPRSLTIAYATGTSLIASVQDTAGRSVSFGYTGNQLTSSTDINGNTWQYAYDSSNEMTAMKSPLCVATSGCNGIVNVYTNGQVTQQTDAAGRVTKFAYSSDGVDSITTITDPNGNVTVDDYVVGMLVSETKATGTPAQATWTYSYDPLTQSLLTVTDPNGNTTTTVRDPQAHVLSETNARGNATTSTFNSFGEILTTTPPAPQTVTTSTYDANGNLLSTSTPLAGTNQSRTYLYTYGDPAHPGDVTSTTDPDNNVWRFAYDQYGNKVASTDPLTNQTSYAYDLAGHMTTKTAARGNVTGCACASTYTSTFTYWASGAPHVVTDPLGHTTTDILDPDGNLLQVTDGNGNVTRYAYDVDDERTSETDGYGTSQARTIQTTYDSDGNVHQQINALSSPQTTTFTYDAQNRLVTLTDPLGRQTGYGYDLAGNRVSTKDSNGMVSNYTFDVINELTSVSYQTARPGSIAIAYQADGHRLSMTDETGTTTYLYDSLGRVIQVTNGASATVGYTYDLAGNLTSIGYPGGVGSVTRTYYTNGSLKSVSDWLGHTTTYNYDPDGNLSGNATAPGILYPNGVQQLNTTDASGRTMGITDTASGGATVLSLVYSRNNANLITGENNLSYGPYDPLNRLTTSSQSSYQYDNADRVIQISPAGTTNVQSLSYDTADELTTSTVTSGGTTISSFNYRYDSNGNRLARTDLNGNATTFVWDQANDLIGYSSSGSTAAYSYNGDGLRMSKTIGNGTTTQQTWDTAEGLPAIIQDGANYYVTGPDGLPLEQIAGTTALFYHLDQNGSVRAITDSAANVTESYSYDPYGNSTPSGSISQPFQFDGQYLDPETGLSYLRARFYDPATGQFISSDPVATATRHRYAFGSDDPLNVGDPGGLWPDWNQIKSSASSFLNKTAPLNNVIGDAFGEASLGLAVGAGVLAVAAVVSVFVFPPAAPVLLLTAGIAGGLSEASGVFALGFHVVAAAGGSEEAKKSIPWDIAGLIMDRAGAVGLKWIGKTFHLGDTPQGVIEGGYDAASSAALEWWKDHGGWPSLPPGCNPHPMPTPGPAPTFPH